MNIEYSDVPGITDYLADCRIVDTADTGSLMLHTVHHPTDGEAD
jgi:hypothetical protein